MEWGKGVSLADVVKKMRARALSQKTEKNGGINIAELNVSHREDTCIPSLYL